MSLTAATVTAAVAAAKAAVSGVLSTVTHHPYASQSGAATPSFSADVTRQAFVEQSHRAITGTDGIQRQASTKLTIVDAVSVSVRDQMTVHGTRLQVLAVSGPVNPATGLPWAVEVWCA